MRSGLLGLGIVLATLPGMAAAQVVDTKSARKQVFSERGRSVTVADLSFLTPDVRKATEQYAAGFDYYGAMAVSPGDPADTGSAVAVQNYHSVASAQAAALKGCEARRTTGKPCVIVATTAPRGYKPRSFTLSVEATTALKKDYRKLKAPKAFAVSPSTGAFGFARGDGGRAIAQCNTGAARKGASDCQVAIQD